MDVYKRYFRVKDGPVIDFIKDANNINDKAHKEYAKILEEIGAKPGYYHSNRKMVGIDFEKKPDNKLFKKIRSGWWPKLNCKFGKELAAKIYAIKTLDINESLALVGLSHVPTLFSANRCYYSTITVIPEESPVAYITVPWYDKDPKEIEQYKKDRKAGIRYESSLDAILWEPSPDMEEVKKWEVDRHICEWNEKIKED